MISPRATLLSAALLLAAPLVALPAPAQPQDRARFAAAMRGLRPGTPEKRILEVLGKPDDVRDRTDPDGIPTVGTSRILGWGCDGHLGFPTLGQVYLDAHGRAQYLFGGQGSPPPARLLPEPELRRLLRLLDGAPALDGYRFDPLAVIQIVNTLQPLGKERALAAMREYVRVSSAHADRAREGLFVILRVLFEVPGDPGHHPPMFVGAPAPPAPSDPRRLPRFPVILEGDVPLLVVSGYMLGGMPQPVSQHLDHFARVGQLRARPLRPVDDPLSLLDRIRRAPAWPYSGAACEQVSALLANQLLRVTASTQTRPADAYGLLITGGPSFEREWKSAVTEARKLGARWSAGRACYLRADGSHVPPATALLYQRQVWRQPLGGGELELTVQRQDPRRVQLELRWSTRSGAAVPHATAVLLVPQPRRQVARFVLGAAPGPVRPGETHGSASAGAERTVVQSRLVELADRWVQPELTVSGATRSGPRLDLAASKGKQVRQLCR